MLKKKISKLILYPIVCLVRLLIWLRYRVKVKGLENLTPDQFKRPGGIVFVPNHPAEIDPVILEAILWNKFSPRPLVVEHFYYMKGFKMFMDLVRALPLPTMEEKANKWRGKKVEKQFKSIVDKLKGKENFLIYPSGRLKSNGLELIGGASFIHKLLQAAPETNLVLIRTTGLWGSKFSKALTGSSPDFAKTLWECMKILLKNGIFFTPRRDVLVELEFPPSDFPYGGSRLEFNKSLENWYNRHPESGPEPLRLVSYSFWKEELPTVFIPTVGQGIKGDLPVSNKVQQEIFAHLASLSGRGADQIQRTMHLSHDLGLDSLDVVQVYLFLDQSYGITNLAPGDLQTVEDVLQFASGRKKEYEAETKAGKQHRFSFPSEKRPTPVIPKGETIQEVFLRTAIGNRSITATLDGMTGPLTYSKLLLGALILSEKFRKMPGDKIGVMLPSSNGVYLIILSILLAHKIPVMINWTAGMKALDYAVDLSEIQVVITSGKFLDRLEDGDLGKIEHMFQLIEEIRQTITFRDKLRGLLLKLQSPEVLLKKLKLTDIKGSDPAVILFTSGTEGLPKGVPLSHSNILSNQRAAMKAVAMRADDILYAVLPPFHSLGFSVTGLFPILACLRVCYSPDPTDSHGLIRDIATWKATLFFCAPSFIKAVFRIADPSQLQSLRLVVSGAEKTPQDLFDYVKEHLPHAQLLEGYGITECSPIVTIDRLDEPHQGVGRPILRVEILILDQETMKPAGPGQEGEICISGPNVFSGYLGNPRNPFITIGSKQWYLSGDRGYLDDKNHLILSGRFKRFIKIGGEMVSLGGLEEELLRLAKEKNWVTGKEEGVVLAVCAKENQGDKPIIILFTTFAISKEDVNGALKNSGYGRIVKISEVSVLKQIPLTGTGKTHYRLLDEIGNSTK